MCKEKCSLVRVKDAKHNKDYPFELMYEFLYEISRSCKQSHHRANLHNEADVHNEQPDGHAKHRTIPPENETIKRTGENVSENEWTVIG